MVPSIEIAHCDGLHLSHVYVIQTRHRLGLQFKSVLSEHLGIHLML